MSLRQQKIDAILKKYGNMITGLNDLTAGDPPSALFYVLADKLSYLLDVDPKIAISSKGVKRRRRINPIIKMLGAHFLNNPQVLRIETSCATQVVLLLLLIKVLFCQMSL